MSIEDRLDMWRFTAIILSFLICCFVSSKISGAISRGDAFTDVRRSCEIMGQFRVDDTVYVCREVKSDE